MGLSPPRGGVAGTARTCSRSSLTTSSTSAAPTAIRTGADPIQYDELRIEHDQGDVEIVVYNRAILLFSTDSEAIRRIHQLCCRLEDLAARCRESPPLLLEPDLDLREAYPSLSRDRRVTPRSR